MKFISKIGLLGLIAILLTGMVITPFNKISSEKPLLNVGDPFPTIKLKATITASDQEYLGIGPGKSFTLKDIRAKILVVEFFNKYCPHCQEQAPVLNDLYNEIQQNPLLQSQVKMLGIGIGNNQLQVEIFKREKNIPFPLFPDANFIIHDEIGRPRTPFIVLFKRIEDGKGIVSAVYKGLVSSKDELLNAIQKLTVPGILVLQDKKLESKDKVAMSTAPKITEDNFVNLAKDYLGETGIIIQTFKRLPIEGNEVIYKTQVDKKGEKKTLFITRIYRTTVCDVCHDLHFWFSFDSDGIITHFVPLYLTKAYNEEWEEEEIQKFTQRILNRSLNEPFKFNPDIDAVTSATITSSIIFDTMNKTKNMFNRLRKEGIVE